MKEGLLDKLWLRQLLDQSTIYSVPETEMPPADPNVHSIVYTSDACSEEQSLFLQKIVQACKLPLEHTCFLNEPIPFKNSKQAFPNLQNIFFFGVPLQAVQIQLQHNEIDFIQFSGVRVICCIDVQRLQQDSNIKNHFWNHILKPVFIN